MKRVMLVVATVALTSLVAFAQGAPKAGAIGVQGSMIFTTVGLSPGDVGIKYTVTDTVALRAGLGFLSVASGGATMALYSLGVGFEYHLNSKGGVSPYVGGLLSYSGESLSGGGSTPTDFALAAIFGGEYFFSPNFSWAGEARAGFDSANSAGATTTSIGTFGFATYVTWYVN